MSTLLSIPPEIFINSIIIYFDLPTIKSLSLTSKHLPFIKEILREIYTYTHSLLSTFPQNTNDSPHILRHRVYRNIVIDIVIPTLINRNTTISSFPSFMSSSLFMKRKANRLIFRKRVIKDILHYDFSNINQKFSGYLAYTYTMILYHYPDLLPGNFKEIDIITCVAIMLILYQEIDQDVIDRIKHLYGDVSRSLKTFACLDPNAPRGIKYLFGDAAKCCRLDDVRDYNMIHRQFISDNDDYNEYSRRCANAVNKLQ